MKLGPIARIVQASLVHETKVRLYNNLLYGSSMIPLRLKQRRNISEGIVCLNIIILKNYTTSLDLLIIDTVSIVISMEEFALLFC